MFDCGGQVTICHGDHMNCGCVIDTSPDKLETEFHQWLKSAPENIEGLCRHPDSYGSPSCFMPSYQNSFYVQQNIISGDHKAYLNQYEMENSARLQPYNGEIMQQNVVPDVQLGCNTYSMNKFQTPFDLENVKTECFVTDSVPGSSYPVEITAKKSVSKKRNGNIKCSKGMGTNLYGRFYCPGRPLDMSVREEIIRLFQQNMKVNQISKILKISHGCVSKIIKRFKMTGNVSPASSPEQRRPRRTKKASSILPNVVQTTKILVADDVDDACLKLAPAPLPPLPSGAYEPYSLEKTYTF
uniref:Paired domain-containing protein n=1 Tax=Syphacia muris TaxID=451379 RepID=A0A0N5A860_9BILA